MSKESIRVSALVPARPDQVYEAWLDSERHSRMTGGEASIDPKVGGRHSAWDGYIVGENVELEPGHRIVQSWRSSEFPPDSEDSRVEVNLEPHDGMTRITIEHTSIPEGQGKNYESGWHEHYFRPMARYFSEASLGVTEDEDARAPEVDDEVVDSTPPTMPAIALIEFHEPARPAARKRAAKKQAPAKAAKSAKSKKKAPAKRRAAPKAKAAGAKKTAKGGAKKAARKAPAKKAAKKAKPKKLSAKKAPRRVARPTKKKAAARPKKRAAKR